MLEEIQNYIFPIIIFNLSIFFFGISLTLFIKTFLDREDNKIDLNIPSYLDSKRGSIKIGRVVKKGIIKHKFLLSLKALEKHMFICGSTGTGKSNFMQYFLTNFTKKHSIPFFLVEFKGEYQFLQKKIPDLLILWPGENFSINIFNPEGTSPEIHAERIFDILKSGQFLDEGSEYSPQMEKVLVEILTKVCRDKNNQNWNGFELLCEKYLRENQRAIPMLSQTLISIKNRIRRFSKGPLKALFDTKHEITINTLFKKNVLLDLSSIIGLGGEKEDALFFLNMILKYLWDINLTRGAQNYRGINHITIIEDAQYFAPRDGLKKNKLTTYLEDIALLQRGTGECLIALATRPDISKEILANTGILITFKNHMEKEIMCELLNLDLENKTYLSILEEGQCIIRDSRINEPFLLHIPLIKREALTIKEILQKNSSILDNNVNRELILNETRNRTLKSEKEEQKELNDEQDPNLIQKTLNINDISVRFVKIQNLYKTNSTKEFLMECRNFIEHIAEKVSHFLNIDFINIMEFLNRIKELNLDKKFKIYGDLLKLNEILKKIDDSLFWAKSEKLKDTFFLIKKVVRKLRAGLDDEKKEVFMNGKEILESKMRNSNDYSQHIKSKKVKDSNKELESFNRLKSFINELYNTQDENE